MKKITHYLILLLSVCSLKAQVTDSIPPVDFRDYMENLFSNINQTPISTGFLNEQSKKII
jgi:hypothetical protein